MHTFLTKGSITPSYLAQIKSDETNGAEFWSKMNKCDWENEVLDYVLTD